MKIVEVHTHLVHAAIPEEKRVQSGAGLKLARQASLIEILTDDGLRGVGPCSFGSASLDLCAVRSLVDNVFAPALLGRDAREIERVWDDLYYGIILRVLGPRGIGVAILSGIDIALWDLKGKALDTPVYNLLGGAVSNDVLTYASSIYWGTPDRSAEEARAYVDQGYSAVKLKIGKNVENDLQSVRAIREEVGSGVDIMVDANMSYTSDVALRVGRVLQEMDVLFFEEPISIDDVEGHRKLAQQLDIRIATGENLYTRFGFVPFVNAGAIDVLQPDASRTGGISEVTKIISLASSNHLFVAPHTFSDAYSVASSLHLCAANSRAFILELDQTYNPLMTDLVDVPPTVTHGRMALSDRAGLGIELNRDWVEDHPYEGQQGIGPGEQPSIGLARDRATPR